MAIPEEENTLCNGATHQSEESRVHPAKVRVKFIESHHVAQVTCSPPSPDVTLDFGSDTMTSPASEHSPDYHRQISHESGIDNPFRPDGELSREADTIVSLIKEGKPITPVKGDELLLDMEQQQPPEPLQQAVVVNGYSSAPHDRTDSAPAEQPPFKGANGAPGIVEVQHGVIVPPTDAPAVEQVVIKKKPKCNCCTIQ